MATSEITVQWPTWADLIEWAKSYPPEEIIGQVGVSESCVIARYLHEHDTEHYYHINSAAEGDCADYAVSSSPDTLITADPMPLPDGPNRIAVTFDANFPYESRVTAGEFVEKFASKAVSHEVE